MGTPEPEGACEPEPIKAIRLRHPWRTVLAVSLVLVLAMFVIDAAQRPAYDWPSVARYAFDRRISGAALSTLQLTVYSMIPGTRSRPAPPWAPSCWPSSGWP